MKTKAVTIIIKAIRGKIETTIDQIFGGHFEIFSWYGWENPNSCFISYFNESAFLCKNRNFGFMILPVKPWLHVYFENTSFGTAKRIAVGIGLAEVFWDYAITED